MADADAPPPAAPSDDRADARPERRPEDRPVVGWRERVGLPDWGVPSLKAKIDTGARTSALHVAAIEELPDGHVRFEVVTRERPTRRTIWVEAEPLVRESVVKPSSGERQQRPVVRTRMQLGPVVKEVELSLVCRAGMLCRMLVGRTALGDDFLVDASRTHVLTKRRRRKRRRPKPDA